jgi:hypothetical protein
MLVKTGKQLLRSSKPKRGGGGKSPDRQKTPDFLSNPSQARAETRMALNQKHVTQSFREGT